MQPDGRYGRDTDTLRPVAGEVQFPGYHAAYRAPAPVASDSRGAAWLTALAGTLIVVLVGGVTLFGLERASGDASMATATAGIDAPVMMMTAVPVVTAQPPTVAVAAQPPPAAVTAQPPQVAVTAPATAVVPASEAAARKVDPRKLHRVTPKLPATPRLPLTAAPRVAPVRTAPATAAPPPPGSQSDKAKQNAIDTLLRASAEHPVGS